ncbi:hypothetical protein DYB38_001608 [Aphanomyces astaci]|uniref:phosphoribosylaminoimidazole carboxylase n=1 Tax=Aphanomyces astaci TaxID=112090 RepID=A0A397D0D4_APHAT|nr:hypothetical protein DYB36_008284 [Aphanomyces astaci]RHY52392.1 hypothetical protein DYB38_001608 [Aphanomyces astaci]RHY54847.1 hypothetical protein DYB34_001183 [Aphanomyces astaci]
MMVLPKACAVLARRSARGMPRLRTRIRTAMYSSQVSVSKAMDDWNALEYDVLEDFAKLDGQRAARTGFPEVVYSEGKTTDQVTTILVAMKKTNEMVLATRVSADVAALVKAHADLTVVCVLCAGTSDLPVAEEAAVTLELAGVHVQRIYDVGVAGLHRLLRNRQAIEDGDAIIVVAGMDGALPGVVGGLTSKPIVAVPTSVG